MEHAIASGAKRHWILDDNIKWFYRLHENMKVPLNYGACFDAIEDFVDRYTNIGLAGMQYDYFAPRKQRMQPFILNTRIYSCILINHEINLKWRGKYNEDTDLSIRVLQGGWCTILFNAFLCGKVPTLNMGGGNAAIYNQSDNRKIFAESLKAQHPDLVEVIERYNRWHHKVDYTPFKKNQLILKKGIAIPSAPNNYGMELVKFNESKSIFNGQDL
jgi:hypothetical protein